MTSYLTFIEASNTHTTMDKLRQHWRKVFVSTFPTTCNKRGPPCALESEPKRRRIGVKADTVMNLEDTEEDEISGAKDISKVDMLEVPEMLEADAMSESDCMSIFTQLSDDDVMELRLVEMGDAYEDIEEETVMRIDESPTPAIVTLQPTATATVSSSSPTGRKDQNEEVEDGKMDLDSIREQHTHHFYQPGLFYCQ